MDDMLEPQRLRENEGGDRNESELLAGVRRRKERRSGD
jgi:hypothetical protein